MDPFLGEIRAFGFNFEPRGWAICQGQLLPVSQFAALYSLLGNRYGGNGTSTFALPNLTGSIIVDPGQGPGLSGYVVGQVGGAATVTLLSAQAGHTHLVQAAALSATTADPSGTVLAQGVVRGTRTPAPFYQTTGPMTAMSPTALGFVGGGQPHRNEMPFLALNYCIAIQGIYPQRP